MSERPIGVFDSGLGGISVLHTLTKLMPNENYIYIGDSKYNPYGTKTKAELLERCVSICDRFMKMDVKAIVIACNTATSACVNELREMYPIDIIGMEPALKVACSFGKKQHIAVWATEYTLKQKKFDSLYSQFVSDHVITKVACPKLVRIVEEDKLYDELTVKQALNEYMDKSLMEQCDSIVLGCTHFVFYKSYLKQYVNCRLVDGNLGTANRCHALLQAKGLLNTNERKGSIQWMNTLEEKIELSKKLFDSLEEME
ncbi:MAG: glutamate racemase [Holdemanella sp.]|nr:glutamate racemase [Holdemanella sp.]